MNECISKGKSHKRYEFGCKVSVAVTSRGGWFIGAQATHGNPYDGHTLADALSQVKRIARLPEHVLLIKDIEAMAGLERALSMWINGDGARQPNVSGAG